MHSLQLILIGVLYAGLWVFAGSHKDDSGGYKVEISNPSGAVSAPFKLKVVSE